MASEKRSVKRKATKHIIIDEVAFEKLTTLRNLIKAHTNKKFTNSVLIELLVNLATDSILEKIETEGSKAIFEMSNKIDELLAKRSKKAMKQKEINLEELMKELKKLKG